jgi:hypothetical protein
MWSSLITGQYTHYTNVCPFEVVDGFKPRTPIDLLSLPLQQQVNLDATKRSDFIKKLHEDTRKNIEKKICMIRETSKQGQEEDCVPVRRLCRCIYTRISSETNARVCYHLEEMVLSGYLRR